MMRILVSFCIFATFLVVKSYADVCRQSCESTYPLHTTSKVSELKSCLTGCRISFITQLSSNLLKTDDIVPTCKKDCDDGYNHQWLKAACHLGCTSQKVQRLSRNEDLESPFELAWHRQLFHPFHHVGRYCSTVYRRAASFVVSSMINQDGSRSTIIMEVGMSPQDDNTRDFIEPRKDERASGLRQIANIAYQHGTKWLNCVESRMRVPYWSLVGILFLSLFFMCWVCCSSCDDGPERSNIKKHVFKEALPLDIDTMKNPPPYFIIANDTAGPLPEKAKLLDL